MAQYPLSAIRNGQSSQSGLQELQRTRGRSKESTCGMSQCLRIKHHRCTNTELSQIPSNYSAFMTKIPISVCSVRQLRFSLHQNIMEMSSSNTSPTTVTTDVLLAWIHSSRHILRVGQRSIAPTKALQVPDPACKSALHIILNQLRDYEAIQNKALGPFLWLLSTGFLDRASAARNGPNLASPVEPAIVPRSRRSRISA